MAVTGPRGDRGPAPAARLLAAAGLVALGGAVGVLARALLLDAFPSPAGTWPWATFGVNVGGSFALGVLLESLGAGADHGWRRTARLACGTGVLGGFTTYSTFAVEVAGLARGDEIVLGVAYAAASVVAGVLAALAGIAVVAAARGRAARSQGGRG